MKRPHWPGWPWRSEGAATLPAPAPAPALPGASAGPRAARGGPRRARPGGTAPAVRGEAFSMADMRRAWRHVRASGGGAGVDGEGIAEFERDLEARLGRLRRELSEGSYKPRPVRRVFVPKPEQGLRPLAIWALRDRVAQRAVHERLEPLFEPRFLNCSHGFRPGRSVETAVRAVLRGRDEGRRWLLDADIRECFDRIDADLLLADVRGRVTDPLLLELVTRWLRADVLDAAGRATPAGAAQGGVLSPLLCNVYLHPFDVDLTGRGIHLVRYADDFLCLCPRKAEAEAALAAARAALAARRLELHPEKTRLTHFDQGFKFLGVFFLRGEHFYLQPRPAAGRGGRRTR